MKVIFVNTNKKWGGGEKWHFDMACALKNRGHDVLLLSLPASELYHKSEITGLRVIPVKVSNLSFLNPFRLLSLKQLLLKELPDAIILNFSSDVKTIGIAAKMAGIRQIIYRRGNAKPLRNTAFNRFLYNKIISRIIVNSTETGNALLKNNSTLVPKERIRVIYNGIDTAFENKKDGELLYKRKGNEIVIGTAGRLSYEKGQHLIIEMASLLKVQHVSFMMLIAGEGKMEEQLRKKIHEAGLENHVLLTGFIKPIADLMESIDIFVLPSLWEGFGYVTVEAMICKKPVVAFRVGSNPEIIDDQVTGFLIKPYDVKELADIVAVLASDPQLAIKMGQAGRKRAIELFSMEQSVKALETFLKEL